jgi:hypothetical protein
VSSSVRVGIGVIVGTTLVGEGEIDGVVPTVAVGVISICVMGTQLLAIKRESRSHKWINGLVFI